VAHTFADDKAPREDQWRNVFDSIMKIKAFTDGKRMRFMLTVYPWPHQISDSDLSGSREGTSICSKTRRRRTRV
jgi:hypothetical protein